RNPEPGTRNPEPEARSPEPGTRNPEPETRNPEPGTRSSKPGTRSPKHETRNTRPETRDPKTGTRNPEPENRNPKRSCRCGRCQRRRIRSRRSEWEGTPLPMRANLLNHYLRVLAGTPERLWFRRPRPSAPQRATQGKKSSNPTHFSLPYP
ncbi:hypothetical protein T484DRAFT_1615657, partial [Baffinella frigidus]